MPFTLGQRWISDTESELGLGTVVAVDARTVTLLFPSTGENRLYARSDSPVTRVMFNPGDTITSHDGWQMQVEEVKEENGLLTYIGTRLDTEGGSLCSRLICPAVTPSTSRASSTSTTTTRSRAPSEALALIFRPLTPVRLGANPSRFTSQAAARIRAIMAMSAPLTCSSDAAETGAEDCTVAWLFITNGSGGASARTG